jgi:zinc protease
MKTREDYRTSIVEYLCAGMLNNRLDELSKMADPPFITAGAGGGRILKTKEAIIYNATVPEGGISRGIETLLLEARRAGELGFTSTELEREKQNILRWIERAYLERNSTPSRSYVREYRRNFLEEETIPGIENEYELFSTYVPAMTLDEINNLAKDWSGEKNRVVLISAPDKSNDRIPDEEEVRLVFERVKSMQITPYEDKTREEPLMAELPTPGTIVHEHSLENIQAIRWILSNGAEVYLKPTDFKSDEVLFEAISPGGHSLVSDEEYIAAITAPTAVKDSGLGNFNRTELEKKLAGQVVSLTPWISEIHEGLEGSASTRDIETLFRLIYLSFTKPRKDPDAFQAYQERLRTRFENRLSNPEEVFWDTVRTTLQQNHYRSRPFTTEILEEMDLDLSFKIFKERFSNASDFTFVFVGSFDIETIKPYVLSYIGGLPSSGTRESWHDLEIDPPSVSVQKRVSMGIDPRSQVQIIFSNSLPWSYERDFFLEAMAEILDMRLRETVREEASGTYGIWVWATTQKNPDNEYTVYIGFGCDPERVEDLTAIVFEQIEWISSGKIEEIYLTKEREILKLNLEKSQRENKYWLNNMATQLRRGEDPGILLKRKELIDQLTSEIVQETARLTLDPEQYIRVVLYPANGE